MKSTILTDCSRQHHPTCSLSDWPSCHESITSSNRRLPFQHLATPLILCAHEKRNIQLAPTQTLPQRRPIVTSGHGASRRLTREWLLVTFPGRSQEKDVPFSFPQSLGSLRCPVHSSFSVSFPIARLRKPILSFLSNQDALSLCNSTTRPCESNPCSHSLSFSFPPPFPLQRRPSQSP